MNPSALALRPPAAIRSVGLEGKCKGTHRCLMCCAGDATSSPSPSSHPARRSSPRPGPTDSSQLVKDWDNDGVPAPADCRPLDPAVYPGAPDKPDLTFEDTNCDGIDGNLTKAIFVDGGGGLDDTRTGTRDFPKKTITHCPRGRRGGAARTSTSPRARTPSRSRSSPTSGIYGGYTPNFSARSHGRADDGQRRPAGRAGRRRRRRHPATADTSRAPTRARAAARTACASSTTPRSRCSG